MITSYRPNLIALSFLFLLGCNTTPNDATCLERYRTAISECDSFLSLQKNPIDLDRQKIKCLSNKGFPKASSSCN